MTDYETAALQTAARDEDDAQTTFIVAGDDAEILEEDGDDDQEAATRPADCQCWDAGAPISCWPCWRDGFKEPNPETPGRTEGDD